MPFAPWILVLTQDDHCNVKFMLTSLIPIISVKADHVLSASMPPIISLTEPYRQFCSHVCSTGILLNTLQTRLQTTFCFIYWLHLGFQVLTGSHEGKMQNPKSRVYMLYRSPDLTVMPLGTRSPYSLEYYCPLPPQNSTK